MASLYCIENHRSNLMSGWDYTVSLKRSPLSLFDGMCNAIPQVLHRRCYPIVSSSPPS